MKKFLSSILIMILLITLAGVTVYAGNGPMPPMDMGGGQYWDTAFLWFYEAKEDGDTKVVYSESTVRNQMQGATYDKASNTLIINNLNTDMLLSANCMGDDFTIKVVGNNKIGHMVIWGFGYGGTLNFTGNGTLTVNPDKIYDDAISLQAETANAALKVGKEVTLNLYAKNDVAIITQTTVNSSNNAIVFANGQTANISKETYNYDVMKRIVGFNSTDKYQLNKATKTSDSTGIYGYEEGSKYINGTYVDGYYIYKLVYRDKYAAYISTTEEEYEFVKKEDLATSGYTLVSGEDYDNCYYYTNEYGIYVDSNKKEYAVFSYYYNDELINEIKNLEKIQSNPDLYMYTENNTIQISSLTPVYENIKMEGYYTYILKGSTFNYKPGAVVVHTHTYDSGKVTKKATFTADGVKTYTCKAKDATKQEKIAKVSIVKLNTTTYNYDGKAKKPGVTVKDSKGKALKNGTDYKITYPSGRKKVGEYKVKITLKGNYSGTKTLSFKINPKGTSLKKLKAGKKQFEATWKAQKTETTGYEVQYSTNKSFKSGNKTVNVKKNKTTYKKIKGLKNKKKYYVRIRTFKKVNTKKFYSSWSKALNVKTK